MIRVNLLPIKQARRRSAGKTQLVVFAMLIVAELLAWGVIYITTSSQLDAVKERVAQNQAEVQQAQAEVKDAEVLEKQKEQLTQQLAVLDELEKSRSGPVRVLDELQSMLSPPRNEEDRFAQLQKNWNVDWDPRRLWISSVSEKDGKFQLNGGAVNADDVAEFLQRLSTGTYFHEVELEYVSVDTTMSKSAKTVQFALEGSLSYAGVKK